MPSIRDYRKGLKYLGNTTKPGNPLWDEYEDTVTGESSLRVHELKQTSRWDTCRHAGKWEVLDSLGNIQCGDCGQGHKLVWGMEIVKDGHIFKLEPPQNTS